MQPTTPTQPFLHGALPRGLDTTSSSPTTEGRFGRMFRQLPVYAIPDDVLVRLGEAMVPPLQPGDDLDTPLDKPDDDENVAKLPNGEFRLPAGYTYFGQFVDHDITFDPVSSLGRQSDPDALVDFRTPKFDLDSLYGRGPADQPYLYDGSGTHLLYQDTAPPPTDSGEQFGFPDLQRNRAGRALIGDPRNDENHIVSQLQVAFIRFHNAVVDRVAQLEPRLSSADLLKLAQQIVRWHNQWIVIHDFLPRLVGQDVVDDILPLTPYRVPGQTGAQTEHLVEPRLRFLHWHKNPFMPIEFSVAAYRYGHSVIRASYKLNGTAAASPIDPHIHRIPIFSADPGPRASLGGMRPLPDGWAVDWRYFLSGVKGPGRKPTHTPQPSYKVDADLVSPLLVLPEVIAGDDPPPPGFGEDMMRILTVRNLLRAQRLGVPSGQDVARAMGIDPIEDEVLFKPAAFAALADPDKAALAGHAPLWFYILREADVTTGTAHLGPVGGRIVAEVLIGLLSGDPLSYLSVSPTWTPWLAGHGQPFTLTDLINVAQEDPER